jgi:hypothetical protein
MFTQLHMLILFAPASGARGGQRRPRAKPCRAPRSAPGEVNCGERVLAKTYAANGGPAGGQGPRDALRELKTPGARFGRRRLTFVVCSPTELDAGRSSPRLRGWGRLPASVCSGAARRTHTTPHTGPARCPSAPVHTLPPATHRVGVVAVVGRSITIHTAPQGRPRATAQQQGPERLRAEAGSAPRVP